VPAGVALEYGRQQGALEKARPRKREKKRFRCEGRLEKCPHREVEKNRNSLSDKSNRGEDGKTCLMRRRRSVVHSRKEACITKPFQHFFMTSEAHNMLVTGDNDIIMDKEDMLGQGGRVWQG